MTDTHNGQETAVDPQILECVLEAVRASTATDHIDDDDITTSDTFDELGLDSLDVIDIECGVEDALEERGIAYKPFVLFEKVTGEHTVRDVAKLITNQRDNDDRWPGKWPMLR